MNIMYQSTDRMNDLIKLLSDSKGNSWLQTVAFSILVCLKFQEYVFMHAGERYIHGCILFVLFSCLLNIVVPF